MQHTSAYVSIRQHTSVVHVAAGHAYVSMRQHASAYVSVAAEERELVARALIEP